MIPFAYRGSDSDSEPALGSDSDADGDGRAEWSSAIWAPKARRAHVICRLMSVVVRK